jgi:hypothetical protein
MVGAMLVLEATAMCPHAVRVNDIHTTSLGKRYLGRQRVQLGGKRTPLSEAVSFFVLIAETLSGLSNLFVRL